MTVDTRAIMGRPSTHPAPRVRVRTVELYERPVTLRLPFRFGAATVTRCPQAFVRVHCEVRTPGSTRTVHGATAELMVPKWFDKSPALTHEQNFEQLREALRCARDAYTGIADAANAWTLSHTAAPEAIAAAVARGLPRLAAQFGPALMDKAVADAVLHACKTSWCDGLRDGLLGDPWSGGSGPLVASGALHQPQSVWQRHTVGLADRLTPDEPGASPDDGLPATLSQAIAHYGLRWFKLKLCGRAAEDIDRLARIASVLAAAPDWRVTLDGNETFADARALADFWRQLRGSPALRELLRRTVLLEQPLPRHLALAHPIDALGIDVPVILDESDDDDSVLERGLQLGYRGISSKACKGIYRSLHSAARIAREPGRLLLSGEDLTCQAGLAVQQDCLLAASLGVTHIERNGHHYVDGFGVAPASEAHAFARACPSLYTIHDSGARLAVRDGRISLQDLHGAGFGSPAQPEWDRLSAIT